MDFVFDTYAIIEIIKGNKNYMSYLNEGIIINSFIFAELCYILTRDGYPNSDKYLDRYEKSSSTEIFLFRDFSQP